MPYRENISYLVPRDPSIKCWSDRVKLPAPCTKNLIQLGSDEFEETMGDKIKVYLRLKPSDSPDNPYTVLSSNVLQTEAPKDSVSYKNVTNGVGKLIHKFTFSSILDQDTTQAALFKKCAVKNLKKFLSGENYLLMAYGTTSAGKTFTMQGNVEHPGVIPRALDFVFTALKDSIIPVCRYHPYQYNEFLELSEEQLKKELIHKNFILSLDLSKYQRYPDASHATIHTMSTSAFSDSYENSTFKEMQTNLTETEEFQVESNSYKHAVWISMIEIYNEQVYDLLEVPNERGTRPKLTFRDDEYGNTFVKSLRHVNVSSGHEAFQILQFGRSNLHLAPTALNHRSSRSHCIFTITLAKFLDYDVSSHAIISRFSFCDLAGMERAKKTLNVKDRLVESKAINTSLSILVKCLTTIKENQNSKEKKIIPYRESKLTKLFRDAIMGKEQFSLIVNVTTEPNLFDETLNVLKFSAIAQKIVPQNVFVKPKMAKALNRSRFSRIVVNSSMHSKSIDWDATTVTDIKIKEETTSAVEELQELVENLKEELARERKRCEQIEVEIREELTSKFSEILKQQNENNQIRLENETERLQEMYERKEKRLVQYYELLRKKGKRKKLDDSDDQYSDYEDSASKLKDAKKEIEFLTSENGALKIRIQEVIEENNKIVAECSELKFTIAEKDRKLEAIERTNKASEEGKDALEVELRKQLAEANAKISDYKSLLDEAASDYKELEENNKYLRNENEVLEQQLTEHRESVVDLKNEINELQKMLSQKRIMIEKLEEASEKMNRAAESERNAENEQVDEVQSSLANKELEILREQFKKTSEKLSQCRTEFDALKAEKADLEKELEISKCKIADLQSKILDFENTSQLGRESELEKKIAELSEELERLKDCKSEMEVLAREKQFQEEKCNELNAEVKLLQKELKDLIEAAKKENESTSEVEKLTKENEILQKELLSLKRRNSEIEAELKEQIENLNIRERESRITLESLREKLEAVEHQNTVLKNLKDEADRQAFEIPRLQEEIKRLEKEIENREKSIVTFNENRQQIFNTYSREMVKLKEENERLRKDILFANEVIVKNMTPLKGDKIEINRLKDCVKKKDEEINKLKAEFEELKKAQKEMENKTTKGDSESSSSREDSPFVNLKKKNHKKVECSPDKLAKQIEALSFQQGGKTKSARKKVDLLQETIHPSTIKNTQTGKKKKGEKEKETGKNEENEKENIPIKKNKCHKQLFTENDFDSLGDLNSSPLEQEIPRLRPRK